MTLREELAIRICGATQYTLPAVIKDFDGVDYVPGEASLIAMTSRCICARNQLIPSMKIARCANCLSMADAAIELLRSQNVVLPE